jgi:hypothetical protein
VHWRWSVGPDSTPADLGDRLVRRGLVRSEVAGLARETAGVAPVPGVAVERVDARTVGEFTDVMARGWSIDPAPLAPANEIAVRDPASRHRLYLARIDGEAIGAAKAIWFERSIYLQGGVVLASHHGRGAYRALVAARLAEAAGAGIPLATSHARLETSEPILVGMGFRRVVSFASYAPPRF